MSENRLQCDMQPRGKANCNPNSSNLATLMSLSNDSNGVEDGPNDAAIPSLTLFTRLPCVIFDIWFLYLQFPRPNHAQGALDILTLECVNDKDLGNVYSVFVTL